MEEIKNNSARKKAKTIPSIEVTDDEASDEETLEKIMERKKQEILNERKREKEEQKNKREVSKKKEQEKKKEKEKKTGKI